MRVLLTGAAGFIGGAVGRLLTETGHEVLGLDAMIPQAHGSVAEVPPGVHRLDVRDGERLVQLLDGVDAVCHQAALVGAGADLADLPAYASHNDVGTATLLAAMARVGVRRLVLASSMVVYGEGGYACAEHGSRRLPARDREELRAGRFDPACTLCGRPLDWVPVPEDAPFGPRSSYAVSKVAQELYAGAWAHQADSSVVALRYHNVYGPGMPRDTPYSGVAALFRSAVEAGRPPRVFEDGGQLRDFVHVDDVARANLCALTATAEGRGLVAFNVCSGTPVSILEVARLVAGSGPEPVVTGEFRLGDVRHVVASPLRAARELGFRARVTPVDGLAAFARAPLR